MLSRLFDTRAIIRTEQRIAGKSLQIAAGHTIALSFLPVWLKALAPHFGEVRARVIPTNVHDSILMLVNGNCEPCLRITIRNCRSISTRRSMST